MRRVFFATLACAVLAGCGDGKFKPNQVVSEVEPGYGVSGRTASVEVRGDFTKWKEGGIEAADVSFGDGITVDAVHVGNEGVLHVDLTIDAAAAAGPRDVTVENEQLHAGFQVVPPFWIAEPVITPGGFLVIDAFGIDTDWSPGRTSLALEGEGTDIFTGGTDLLGLTTEVLVHDRDFLQIVAWADLTATAGVRDVTIQGATRTDMVPDALTVAALEPTALSAGATTVAIRGGEAVFLDLPTAAAGDAHALAFAYDTGHPLGYLFDPDVAFIDGIIQTVSDYDLPFASNRQTYARAFLATDKSYRVLVWETQFIVELIEYLDGTRSSLPSTADRSFEAELAVHAETLAAGTPATAQTLGFAGDARAWRITPSTRWMIVGVNVDNPEPDLDAVLRVERSVGAPAGTPAIASGDTGYFGDPESISTLAGSRRDAMIIVSDYDGYVSGADSAFDVGFTESAIPGTFFEASAADQAIGDSTSTVFNFTVNGSGITALSAVHLALDIEHPDTDELSVTLTSPLSTVRSVFSVGPFNRTGVIEVYPDTASPSQPFDFTGAADGTWTLTITDGVQGNTGTLKGWALSFEGT